MGIQQRFLNCSVALEIVFAVIMLIAFGMSITKGRQKKYDDNEDPGQAQLRKARMRQQKSLEAVNDNPNPSHQGPKQPPKDQPPIQHEVQQPFCTKMVQKIDLFFIELPLLSILALNIVCFSSYEYLLTSAIAYIVLTLIRLQDFCGIKNIYIKLFLEKFPLVIIISWFVNFFISDLAFL